MTVWSFGQYVAEHRAERIPLGPAGGGSHFHRFRDGQVQRARAVRVGRQRGLASMGMLAGAGIDLGPKALHTCTCTLRAQARCKRVDAAMGFLVIADLDHVDFQVDAEEVAGHGQRAAPLPGAGLGGQGFGAGFLVEADLCSSENDIVPPELASRGL